MFGCGSVEIKANLYRDVFVIFCQYIAVSQGIFRQKNPHFALTTLAM